MRHFGDIMFTDNVKEEQKRHGSRDAYAKMTAKPAPGGLSEREAAFISMRDSFYMASVTETGWPYIQHRGGPKGFVKVLDEKTLAINDYRGNKQYISTGNVKHDGRVALFFMDYPNRARLKVLAHARIEEAAPERAAQLSVEGEGRVERVFVFQVEAFDWNCPQFITPRFSEEELQSALAPMAEDMERLREENARLKKALRRSGGRR